MHPEKVLWKAEAWKRKSHRLALTLRLKSLSEAAKFIREQRVVLWKMKAELPNLLDASLGRIAKGKERIKSKSAENCDIWRRELLKDPEIMECRFFRKSLTAVHQELWPALTWFSQKNRERIEEENEVSREAKKLLIFLEKEGPVCTDVLRKHLKIGSGRTFSRIRLELESLLLIRSREEENGELLEPWGHGLPGGIRTRSELLQEKEAALQVLSATLHGTVLAQEKDLPEWFFWSNGDMMSRLEELIRLKEFIRMEFRKKTWILPRKILTSGQN